MWVNIMWVALFVLCSLCRNFNVFLIKNENYTNRKKDQQTRQVCVGCIGVGQKSSTFPV